MRPPIGIAVYAGVCTLLGAGSAGGVGPGVGDRAPALTPEKLLQAPAGTAAADLAGQAVVLEFWGTWCGPCLAAIPHLNELSASFKDRPVRFVAATDQPEDKVSPLLKRRPMKAWVALDTDRSMFEAFGVQALPHTVLIDRAGVVRAVTTPLAVTSESIEDLLAGREIRLQTTEAQATERRRLEQGEPLPAVLETIIRPAQANVGRSSVGPGRFELRGKPLTSAVTFLTGVGPDRIDGAQCLPDDPFDVIVRVPPEQDEQLRDVLRRTLAVAFGVSVRTEERQVDAIVLRRTGQGKKLRAADPNGPQSSSAGAGRLDAVGCPLGHVSGIAQRELGGLIVDETGGEVFDFEFTYTPSDREGFLAALRDQLGVTAERARRAVTYAVIEPGPG